VLSVLVVRSTLPAASSSATGRLAMKWASAASWIPLPLSSNQTRSPMAAPPFGTMTTALLSLLATGSYRSRPEIAATLVIDIPEVFSRTVTLM